MTEHLFEAGINADQNILGTNRSKKLEGYEQPPNLEITTCLHL